MIKLPEAFIDNMTPDGVAAVIALLRSSEFGNKPTDERAAAALKEVAWLADELTDLLGHDEYHSLLMDMGL